MTRITGAAIRPYRLRLRAPHADARGEFGTRDGAILAVDTPAGPGLGDCAPLPGLSAPLADCLDQLAPAAQRLVGLALDEAWEWCRFELPRLDFPGPARAALEGAVTMPRARQLGQPPGALLLPGRPRRPAVPVNALVDRPDPGEALEQARAALAAGFAVLKVKVGADPDRDRALLRTLRTQLGSDWELRLDANGAWTPQTAADLLPDLRAAGVALIEQPFAPAGGAELPWMAEFRRESGIAVALDESCDAPAAAAAAIAASACDALVVKPSLVGLLAAAEIVAIAGDAGLPCIVTGAFESGVGLTAAMELAACLHDPLAACGLSTGLAVLDDPASGVPLPSRGWLAISAGGIWPAMATVAAAGGSPPEHVPGGVG
ncbi:mandelate racemase/muconate lactonizing enzyme family protein [Tepidiforma sp.]|uniref:mandelate racemase/muconate lactonizing enzyme family protein n=1 Tax=Tepidiforma sp. TaxID=2682230 RepID=UPI002ADD84A3|nr:enolase C-terminal domain-like protein [Tepidiforma sp.]